MNHASTGPFDAQLSAFPDSPWVVLKFGGTSVASLENWQRILGIVRARITEGRRVLLVHSAVSGVSNRLEELIEAAIGGDHQPVLDDIARRHRVLGEVLALDSDTLLDAELAELGQLAAGIALIGEASPRTHARVMAAGELMATRLGAAWLGAQGVEVQRVDARELLRTRPVSGASERGRYLSAACGFDADDALRARLDALPGVVLTQGFIAGGEGGETVLLGRGGSDTSAACLAAHISAQRLEIWTDVPGLFSADPRAVPSARLLKSLHYFEAQELASMGSRVLHPRCIPPVRRSGIPLYVFCTSRPDWAGTIVSAAPVEDGPQLKAVSSRKGITLVSMETLGMWQEVGFLSRAFECFARHGLSVDMISTSESNVTVSLEQLANALDDATMAALVADLEHICRVRVITDCAAVSLVGRGIRAILHELGPAFELFEDHRIHLLSQAANDLNLTVVVDEEQAHRLVEQLHVLMMTRYSEGSVFGPTWQQLHGDIAEEARPWTPPTPWWVHRRDELLAIAARDSAAYVYDLPSIRQAIDGLKRLPPVSAVFYAMKANSNRDVLRCVHDAGVNFECVSPGEIGRVLELFPDLDRRRILYTPNFAPKGDYQYGLERDVWVTLDNLHPLRAWPELFDGREIFVRLDPGQGRGHHEHVRTAGVHSKFGIPLFELDELQSLARAAGARIVGLHAHTGSGILSPENWGGTGSTLIDVARTFPDVRYLDLGGGLGVPERPGERPLDLAALEQTLEAVREAGPDYELWLEPGRYLVAAAGVLLAQVTQLKGKGDVRYVGLSTGMNSLIRPALYGAYHEIVNLSRLDETPSEIVSVVGPNCESGDRLGTDRLLPHCEEGDVLLIANAGAYGFVMSSNYNLRAPAGEVVIGE